MRANLDPIKAALIACTEVELCALIEAMNRAPRLAAHSADWLEIGRDWLKTACRWELNRRLSPGTGYQLQPPQAAMPDGEHDVSIEAVIALRAEVASDSTSVLALFDELENMLRSGVGRRDELLAAGAYEAARAQWERSHRGWERNVWQGVISFIRKLDDHLPAWLDFEETTLKASTIAERVAQACFGDSSLVYDCAARLLECADYDANAALGGSHIGFEPPSGETLSGFIETKRRGVVVFDDVQAFDPSALRFVATIAATGLIHAERPDRHQISTTNFVILARARVSVPSPRGLVGDEINQPIWRAGTDTYHGPFEQVFWQYLTQSYPMHFDNWVLGRLWTYPESAWERFCELVRVENYDEVIFHAPRDVPAPPTPRGFAAIPRNLVLDVESLSNVTPTPEQFDVFISYSWARTAERATWLHEQLRSFGFRVFLDQKYLPLDGIVDEDQKKYLIQKLVWAVKSSRACILFAIQVRPYRPTLGFDDEAAIQRGLAMPAGEGIRSITVEWSWQTLEMRHASTYLVIDDDVAYKVGGGLNGDSRKIVNQHDMLTIVLEYLESVGVHAGSHWAAPRS